MMTGPRSGALFCKRAYERKGDDVFSACRSDRNLAAVLVDDSQAVVVVNRVTPCIPAQSSEP